MDTGLDYWTGLLDWITGLRMRDTSVHLVLLLKDSSRRQSIQSSLVGLETILLC